MRNEDEGPEETSTLHLQQLRTTSTKLYNLNRAVRHLISCLTAAMRGEAFDKKMLPMFGTELNSVLKYLDLFFFFLQKKTQIMKLIRDYNEISHDWRSIKKKNVLLVPHFTFITCLHSRRKRQGRQLRRADFLRSRSRGRADHWDVQGRISVARSAAPLPSERLSRAGRAPGRPALPPLVEPTRRRVGSELCCFGEERRRRKLQQKEWRHSYRCCEQSCE